MQTVIVVIHLLIVIALVGVILVQRSEGGGLGIGGGSGFMTARGTKNALTRFTAILAACFFVTSITLVVVNNVSNPASDILNRIPATGSQTPASSESPASAPVVDKVPANGEQPSILEQLGGKPTGNVPTATTPTAQQPESSTPKK